MRQHGIQDVFLPATVWMGLVLVVAGCGSDTTDLGDKESLEPMVVQDAEQFAGLLADNPDLCSTGQVTAEFGEEGQAYGYLFEAWEGDSVTLETTGNPDLDTTLFLFGPDDGTGFYGANPVAMDDDGGEGVLSKIDSFTIEAKGIYMVVMGTYGGMGKGEVDLTIQSQDGPGCPVWDTPLVDVLFVVDDSPGMCQEQLSLSESFGSFLDGLNKAGPVDVRVAVTTTNVCGFQTCSDNDQCYSGECGTYLGEGVCFCTTDEDCGGTECRVIAGNGVCLRSGAVRGKFVYHPATVLPPECVEKMVIPCVTDADCQDSPLLPVQGDWRCEGKPEQYTYTCDKPVEWGVDPYPGEILHTVNTSCRFHCTTDEECTAAFGNPRYYCLFPGGDETRAGCSLPPDTSACPENGPTVLDSSFVDLYLKLWKAGSWQGLPIWDSLNEEQAREAIFDYLFNCMASVGAAQNICGSQEQGLLAALLAIDPDGENAVQAQEFHREDATLVIVVASNEEDCSSAEKIPAIEAGRCPCMRDTDGCTVWGSCDRSQQGPLIPVGTFVEKLAQLKPNPDQVLFAAFVGGVSLGSGMSPGQDVQSIMDRFYECKCDNGQYAPFTYSCMSPSNGKADLGSRYMAVATALGGVIWNICSDLEFKPALEQIALEVIGRIQQAGK